jgi:hypothetical protein
MPTRDELDLLPLLTVVSGPLRGASFRLWPGGPQVIGRAEGVDILIKDRRVSRRHATVELAAGGTLLRDSESTNGSWVNDRRVSGAAPLRDGDRIRLGEVELRFFDPASAPTDPGGTLRLVPPALPRPPMDGAVSRPTAAALAVPTQAMAANRPRQLLLMIGGCVALAGWMAGAYLIFQ